MKKTKNKVKKIEPKIFINHGIFIWIPLEKNDVFYRNTETSFPIPVKFRELLEYFYLQWWHVKKTIYRFGKPINISCLVPEPVEFTMAHEPIMDVKVIAIVHPLDQFKRKSGVKIVRNRMEWALKKKNHKKERSWKSKLKK